MKIFINNSNLLKDLNSLAKELKKGIETGIDIELDKAIDELKSKLTDIINNDIKVNNTIATKDNPAKPLDIPKSKNDLIKEVFGTDIAKSDLNIKSLKNNIMNDNSNVFILKDNRIKAFQAVQDSSTYSQQENFFKERLKEGIVVDVDLGEIIKLPPDAIKDIKVECSTDTGQTLKSDKKFDAYKNSTKITRRKEGSPDQRVAVWTVKQESLKDAVKKSISVDKIISQVQTGDYTSAIANLNQYNKNGGLAKPLENLEKIKEGKIASPQTAAYQKIQELIKNLKIRKRISDNKTTYTLFTNYDRDIEETELKFFDALKIQIYLWQVQNEHLWLDTMANAAKKVLKKYGLP